MLEKHAMIAIHTIRPGIAVQLYAQSAAKFLILLANAQARWRVPTAGGGRARTYRTAISPNCCTTVGPGPVRALARVAAAEKTTHFSQRWPAKSPLPSGQSRSLGPRRPQPPNQRQ